MANTFVVELSKGEVRSRVLQAITAKGGTVTAQSDEMVTATFGRNASCLITLILLLLGLIPGLIYWFWAKKSDNLLVQLSGDDSAVSVSVTSGGKAADDGRKAVLAAFGQTAGQKMAAATVSGAVSAGKAVGVAATKGSQAVSDQVAKARAERADTESDVAGDGDEQGK